MKKLSVGEETFALHCRASLLEPPEREFRFHLHRRWKFDFAWVEPKIACEIEGGTWSAGRHTRGKGFASDCAKYNAAALLGWRVFRFTTEMVTSGEAIVTIVKALSQD